MNRAWYRRLFYDTVWSGSYVMARLLFGLRVVGRQNFPDTGGGLICSNHQSYFDPVFVGVSCRRRMNYLARKSLFRFGPFAWLIYMLDAIPINREGMGIGGLKETLRRLKRGELVLIFPEGTRSPDGEVQPLQSGFLAVARRAKVPLIPVGLDGAFQAWPRQARFPRLTKICVSVGQPLAPDEFADWSDDQVIEELSRRIRDCFEQARGGD